MLTTYSPTGKNDPLTFALILPIIIVGAVAAVAYAFLSRWIPLIYLDAVLVIVFGYALYQCVQVGLTIGKCRNPATGAMIGLFAGIIATGTAHYVSYLNVLRSMPPGTNLAFGEYLKIKADVGWTIGKGGSGIPIKGIFVWLIWAIEAVIVIGAAIMGGLAAASKPFCESCNVWANLTTHQFAIPGIQPASVERISNASDLEPILMPPLNEIGPGPNSLAYRVRSCPTCKQVAFLDLALTTTTVDKKGKTESSTKPVGKLLVLTPAEGEAIGQLQADVEQVISAAVPTSV